MGETVAPPTASFSRRSKAFIGPHSLEILSILFGSLLGDLIRSIVLLLTPLALTVWGVDRWRHGRIRI